MEVIELIQPSEYREHLIFDNTMIEAYLKCPRFFLWSQVQGIQIKSTAVPLVFGQAIHKALEVWYVTNNRKEAEDAFSQIMIEGGVSDDKRNLESGLLILDGYFKKYISEPFTPIIGADHTPELTFCIPIYKEFSYCGKLDLPITYKPFGVLVADHKTTSSLGPTYFYMAKPNRQFAGYVWGTRPYFEKVYGVMVNAILVAKTKMGFEREIVPFHPIEIEEWVKDTCFYIDQITAAYKTDNWPIKSSSCTYYGLCPYHTLCAQPRSWRDVVINPNTYERRWWNPLEREAV